MEFKNKNILITGASVGIGKETALLLDKLGANLILLDIDENGLANLKNIIPSENHKYYTFNLADTSLIDSIVSTIISENGTINGFVNCVGIRSRRPLNLLTPEIIMNVMNVNVVAFVEFIRCITKKGRYAPNLNIVGVSSISSKVGGATVTAYAASKAAMDASVRCLAKELSVKGIRINTVIPSQINTPEYKKLRESNINEEDKILSRQYLGLGEPIDVANVIAFLLSDKSRFISGSAIPVDGGFLTS